MTQTTAVQSRAHDVSPVNDHITAEEWLRGYFHIVEEDVRGASQVKRGRRKNIDFMRLRDVGLHLLDAGPGKVVLDLGCANGAGMVYAGLQGAKVYGQDLDVQGVADANQLLKRFNLDGEAIVGDVTNLTFKDNMFDAVISSDFAEHITDDVKIKVLREVRRVLKPGGVVITKTPNLAYLELSLAYKRLRALARFENPLKYVIPQSVGTSENPDHIGLTTRWAFTRCLLAAGFLNYDYHYSPLRRFGASQVMEVLSTEIPVVRDLLCEDLFCRAYKPIANSHFPD